MKASTANVASYLKKISESNDNAITICGYEAGPTGYKLCLDIQRQGFNCVIMAPTSIAKTAKDKMLKTDRADAQMLARTLAYHSYKQVVLPTEDILAIKEVVRLRASSPEKLQEGKAEPSVIFTLSRNLISGRRKGILLDSEIFHMA